MELSNVKKYDMKYFFVVLVLLAGTIFQCLLLLFSNEKADIDAISKYSVVEVKAETDEVGESFGTAVFVKKDGTLITNAHVVSYKKLGEYQAFDKISIRFSTEDDYRDVSLIKYDNEKDLAVLKLNNLNCKYKPIKFGSADKLKFGDKVFALGNLNNVGISLTEGIISNPKINVTYN